MTYHPQTGLRYVGVFSVDQGWEDHALSYATVSRDLPWLEAYRLGDGRIDAALDDKRAVVFYWNCFPSSQLPSRAFRAHVVAEPVAPVVSDGIARYREALRNTKMDILFAHTPRMAEQVENLLNRPGPPVRVLPAGLDPSLWHDVRPVRDVNAAYYGTCYGRREWAVPIVRDALGGELVDLSGRFGPPLLRELSRTKFQLYLSHEEITSGPTWRLWQSLAAGTPLMVEGSDDLWPAVRDQHYVALPMLARDGSATFVSELKRLLRDVNWFKMAQQARDDLGCFTTRRCVEDYLVSACISFQERRT